MCLSVVFCRRVGHGSLFQNPTQPNPKFLEPTQPNPQKSLPDPTQPIIDTWYGILGYRKTLYNNWYTSQTSSQSMTVIIQLQYSLTDSRVFHDVKNITQSSLHPTQPNPTQPNPPKIKKTLTQPNPWMYPTHDQLCCGMTPKWNTRGQFLITVAIILFWRTRTLFWQSLTQPSYAVSEGFQTILAFKVGLRSVISTKEKRNEMVSGLMHGHLCH